ncbi:nectin-4-like isoform 2-T2 [Pholidichthys leucotaenia]
MDSAGRRTGVLALLSLTVACVLGDFVEPLQPNTHLQSSAETQTRLPCHYQVVGEEKVIQVTWFKVLPDGIKDQIITAHFVDGQTKFGRYSGRVKFENSKPTQNSALLITNTDESDEGSYTCHISTFPNGNFERHITLTIWILPIATLETSLLTEGQPFTVAAKCRAVGRPSPLLQWDTDLYGQVQNYTRESGAVSSSFSLHPLRTMNGKKLDCLVQHPALKEARRLTSRLEVQYPPDATISTSPHDLYLGLEKAELECKGGGHPKVQSITWTRKGAALPDGASVVGGRLIFGRALHLNDSGVYECVVSNAVGVGKAEYTLRVNDKSLARIADFLADNRLLIITVASAVVVVIILVVVIALVHRHHRHRTKALRMELNEKNDEIDNLSRQTSYRSLRVQGEDYSQLRVNSRMKNSQMSLDHPYYKSSHSTLGGKWGPPGVVELDELGRPVVWQEGLEGAEIDLEKAERRRRVESYVKTSNMSLAQQDDGSGPREPELSHPQEGEDWAPTQPAAEEPEDGEDSGSYQISTALHNHFYHSNGFLRPKPHSNAILLHPRAQMI